MRKKIKLHGLCMYYLHLCHNALSQMNVGAFYLLPIINVYGLYFEKKIDLKILIEYFTLPCRMGITFQQLEIKVYKGLLTSA